MISDACGALNREVFEIQPDGHCMYSAVADQLGLLGILPPEQANNPYTTRRVAAKYMREHKDDFLPFLASVDGEDMPGATDDGIMSDAQFGEYCHRVEGTAEWGGEPEVSGVLRVSLTPDPSPLARVRHPDPRHPARAAHRCLPWRAGRYVWRRDGRQGQRGGRRPHCAHHIPPQDVRPGRALQLAPPGQVGSEHGGT